MNTNVKNISEIVDDIKESITDNQYKTIMDNLMTLNRIQEYDNNVKEINMLWESIFFYKKYISVLQKDDEKQIFIERKEFLEYIVFHKIKETFDEYK